MYALTNLAPPLTALTALASNHIESASASTMTADVLTIENSRSGDAMVRALAAAGYTADLGPGERRRRRL